MVKNIHKFHLYFIFVPFFDFNIELLYVKNFFDFFKKKVLTNARACATI